MAASRTTIVLTAGYALALASIVVLADSGALAPLLTTVHAIPLFDKVGHLVLMGLLALALNLALGARTFGIGSARFYVGSAIVGVVVVLEEISQRWFPSRSFDPGDLAADALGIALAGAIVTVLQTRLRRAPATFLVEAQRGVKRTT